MKTLVIENSCCKCKKYHKRGKECKYCWKKPVTTVAVFDCEDIQKGYWFTASQPSCPPRGCIQGRSKCNPYINYCRCSY